ncbi:RHS repeat domain-containing protein, partial [Streptomyces chartreusis]|uniref:RHS repeat domain-containing protein n=1 Tax=Streptomyces chartreusis TaxID=1969 RepID=UPI0036DBCB46
MIGTLHTIRDACDLITSTRVNAETPIKATRNQDGRLESIGDLTVVYDSISGHRKGATLGGVAEFIEHNSFGEPVEHRITYNGLEIYSATYEWDSLSRITNRRERVLGEEGEFVYTYDGRGQLASVTVNGVATTLYTYDSNGNRTEVVTEGASVRSTYNDQDQMMQQGGAYLLCGLEGEIYEENDQSVGAIRYQYNSFGSMNAVELPDGTRVEYIFDAAGRRIARSVNGARTRKYLFDGLLHPVAELDETDTVVAQYVYADSHGAPAYISKDEGKYFIASDHLGSPRLVIQVETGEIVQQLDYDPWGVVVKDTEPGFQPFGFSGGLYDPLTRLVRCGARDYSASLGRWMQKDPRGMSSGSTNLYAYCENDPVNAVDPTGLTLSNWAKALWALYLSLQPAITPEQVESVYAKWRDQKIQAMREDEKKRKPRKKDGGGGKDDDDPPGGSCPAESPASSAEGASTGENSEGMVSWAKVGA